MSRPAGLHGDGTEDSGALSRAAAQTASNGDDVALFRSALAGRQDSRRFRHRLHQWLRRQRHLYGKAGNDRIDGGAGNDSSSAARRADILTGGPGIDRFRLEKSSDTVQLEGPRSATSGTATRSTCPPSTPTPRRAATRPSSSSAPRLHPPCGRIALRQPCGLRRRERRRTRRLRNQGARPIPPRQGFLPLTGGGPRPATPLRTTAVRTQ